jgi:hypothetical protein
MSFERRVLREVVIEVESTVQPRRERPTVQDDSANECGSYIAAVLKQFGPGSVGRS